MASPHLSLLSRVRLNIKNSSERTKNIVRHVRLSVSLRIGSVLANFMMVPLAINYLGTENYGIWLTISSVLTWFALFDIGLGNGLRNKFAESKASGNDLDAQAFVSTAYYTIGCIGCLLIVSAVLFNYLLDWSAIFNTSSKMRNELSTLLPVVFSFFTIQLVAKLVVSIYQADQHHSIQDKVRFFGQILSLAAIWLLTKTDGDSLLIFGLLYSALPLLILLSLNIYAFRGKYKKYRPKIGLCNKTYLNGITGLGVKFFVIQIAAVVLFSTDNFIITQLFGPEEVVPYSIAFKYFSIVTFGYGVLIAPFWSSFTDAYAKSDIVWIKNSVSTIHKLWLLIPAGLVVMVFVADLFYKVWVGENVVVPFDLTLFMALYVLLITYNMIYVQFINGVGKIQIQLIVSIVVMLLNIPLSIFLAGYAKMGTSGVILATSFCIGIPMLIWKIQYHKLINGTAQGIWNK